jgi:polyphosphate glucokinase
MLRHTGQSVPLKGQPAPRDERPPAPRALKRTGQRTTARATKSAGEPTRTLVVDVGATGIKATLLNDLGRPVEERVRRETPPSGMPGEVMDIVVALAKHFDTFDRVAVGFPGVIIDGIVKEAPNLAPDWQDFNIADVLQARLKKPVRVANDADVQGYGAIAGTGVELVVTLGTGVGTSLFVDGRLVPNLEIGSRKLRAEALEKAGKKKWNKRVAKFVRKMDRVFHFTRLYIGGGNSREVDVSLLPANVTIVSNVNGLIGGLALWRNGQGSGNGQASVERERSEAA